MLIYATLGTNDMPRAVIFWGAVMAQLGHPRLADAPEAPGWAFWGQPYDEGFSLCLCPPFDGRAATAGNGAMLAFRCDDAALVAAAHAAGIAAGGTDEGAPGLRPHYGAGFYAAYLRDPDGNKLALICHDHRPAPG
jgi:catechol 2,3-dioxygenase-like lactoylglutathione lyase family enzyme